MVRLVLDKIDSCLRSWPRLRFWLSPSAPVIVVDSAEKPSDN
jgi:hypothetical protein